MVIDEFFNRFYSHSDINDETTFTKEQMLYFAKCYYLSECQPIMKHNKALKSLLKARNVFIPSATSKFNPRKNKTPEKLNAHNIINSLNYKL